MRLLLVITILCCNGCSWFATSDITSKQIATHNLALINPCEVITDYPILIKKNELDKTILNSPYFIYQMYVKNQRDSISLAKYKNCINQSLKYNNDILK